MNLKIGMRKFTKMLFGRSVIGASRVFKTSEVSEMNLLVVEFNSGAPFPVEFTPRDALRSTGIAHRLSTVCCVLRPRAVPKIFSAIVESVVVAVVRLGETCNRHMHQKYPFAFLALLATASAEGSGILSPQCEPVPLIQPIIVSGVNDRRLAPRERNKFDRLVERLDNFVSDNTGWLHRNLHSCAAFSRARILPLHSHRLETE